MTITSTAFQNNDEIPARYGRTYDDVSPPLDFDDVPETAASLALIMDDPDATSGTFTHWVVYDIPPATTQITEDRLPPGALEGVSDYGTEGYGGPMPPSGTHRYVFKLFALDGPLELEPGATSEELQEAMEDHIVANAELTGTYPASERI
jgi:hypothetical protein